MPDQNSATEEAGAERVLRSVFDQLEEWHHLPAYQLERRVDVFFGMVLPRILEARGVVSESSKLTVIPEFPLHKDLREDPRQSSNHQSRRADFAVFCSEDNGERLILVELKTDDASLDGGQLKHMCNASRAGSRGVLQGVIEAAKASAQKRKYGHLIWSLLRIPCLSFDGTSGCTEETYRKMNMSARQPRLATHFKSLQVHNRWSNGTVDPLLIFPGHEKKAVATVPEGVKTIKFTNVCQSLESEQNPLARLLAQYMNNWAACKAGHRQLAAVGR